MTKKTISVLAFLMISTAAFAGSADWSVDMNQGTGSVEFHATGHPSALKIVGKGTAPHGTFTDKSGHVTGFATFDLDSLDTGIAMRTKHMKEKYLETGKYREAKLTVDSLTLPASPNQDHFSADQVPFKGKLSLHGVEKPVSGVAKIERNGNTVSLTAQFGLKIGEFGITTPTFAGITMADDVQISVIDSAPLTSKSSVAKE